MNLNEFSLQELTLAGLLSPKDDFYGGETGKAVLELIEVFSKQGHSGMSAQLVADIFWKLANHKPLSAITGQDSEWKEIEGFLQNKRCFSLFKKGEEVTYGKAIIFRDPEGSTWTGSCWLSKEDYLQKKGRITSSQKIKGFPFNPKSFWIDVEKVEIGDEVQSIIKDKRDLDAVSQYYDFSFRDQQSL